MTREEFEEALMELCPSFELRKDRKGQLVVHTGLIEDEYGELIDIHSEEVEAEFSAEDEEVVPLEDEDEDD